MGQTSGLTIFPGLKKRSWHISMVPCWYPSRPILILASCSQEAIKLGKLLFPLFALALGLSEDFFENKVDLLSTTGT